MGILLQVLVGSHLIFAGGTAQSLAKELATESKAPSVAVLLTDSSPLNSFDLKWSEQKDLKRLFPVVTKLELAGELSYGVSRKGWPQFTSAYNQSSSSGTGPSHYLTGLKEEPLPKGAFDDKKVSFINESGKYLAVSRIGAFLSKPLKIHWWFESLAVAVYAKDAPEAQFLGSIASAIGADFVSNDKEYRFDFSPSLYRHRALDALNLPRPLTYPNLKIGKQYEEAVNDLLKATITVMTDNELKKVFAKPNGSISIEVRDPRLEAAVAKKMDAVRAFANQTEPEIQQAASIVLSQLGMVDWEGKFHVIFGPPGNAGVDAPMKGTKGRTVF